MSKYAEIIERLEKATGPDREIDLLAFKAFNPDYDSDEWQEYAGGIRHRNDGSDIREAPSVRLPYYTLSIDSAVYLAERVVALEGRKLICFFCAGGQLTPWNADEGSPDYHPKARIDNSVTVGWMAHIRFYNADGSSEGAENYSHGKTAPLAILLSLFRALEAKERAG